MDKDNRRTRIHEEYRQALRDTYHTYIVPALGEERAKEPLRFLSIGCGSIALEARESLNVFPQADYRCIDVDDQSLRGARRLHQGEEHIVFDTADATKKEVFGDDPYDIVVLHNPQVLGSLDDNLTQREEWETVVNNSWDSVSNGGVFFATLQSIDEATLLARTLRSQGIKCTAIENEYGEQTMGKKDMYLIVAKKP